MSQVKQNDTEKVFLELLATTVARLREKADSAGQPLDVYLRSEVPLRPDWEGFNTEER